MPLFPVLWSAVAHPQEPVRFQDVLRETGITFRHTDGSSGNRYIIESMTGGMALFDYDDDGDLDIYFLNGAPLKGTHASDPPRDALYRNEGNWRFSDVTRQAGVGDTGYGMGIAVADFNNDGYADIYINNFGSNVLYQNNGDGTFTDVTTQAGVANGNRTGAGVIFLDMDADSDVDLFVGNYVQFSYERHKPHQFHGIPSYPSPLTVGYDPSTVYRNDGDGTFTDVSDESGVAAFPGPAMGLISCDYDDDGDSDVFVANDVHANYLFQNDGRGKFSEVGLLSGTAYDVEGNPHGNMGVDAGDFDNDGRTDFYVTAFSREWSVLYRNLGQGLFEDVTRVSGAGEGTFPHVKWGTGFADFDNNGHADLFVACGHIDDNVELRDDTTTYRVRNFLLMNTGLGRFVDVSRNSGPGLQVALASRGTALGDLDNDGDMDVVVMNSRSEPTILRNESRLNSHWLATRLIGTRSNRMAVGAKVKIVAGDLVQVREVCSGRGYQSHFDTRLHFGLGSHNRVDRVEIRWLGGDVQELGQLAADQLITVHERSRSP